MKSCVKCQTIVRVHPCQRCNTPVCEKHAGFALSAEYMYDKDSWVCFTSCRGLALVKYNPRFLRFECAYSDAAYESLMIALQRVDRQLKETLEEVRVANRVLAA